MDEELKLQIKAYDEFTAIMDRFSKALEGVEKSEKAMAATTETVNKAVSAMLEAIKKTGPPLEQGRRQTDEKAKADREAAKAAQEHKQKVDGLVQGLTSLGILATVKRGLDAVVDAGGKFDQQLGILYGMTGQAVDQSQALIMGLEIERKGVTELALGMNELARSGYNATESMEALPELAQFSKAAFKEIGDAGAPVISILKTFNMAVEQTGEVTDVLTTAANRSALGFDDFQLGLAMSAGVAKMAGQSYQELVAELSVLRDAGLGASDAGTSIKSAWLALMNPTEEAKRVMKDLNIEVYDSQGRMKTWADIVASTERALKPLNEQSRNLALTTIFGSDGVRAMALSMGRGSEYIRSLTADLRDSEGATAELAHAMGETFTGATERVAANLERMKVQVFDDLKGAMFGVLEAVDTLIVGFNSMGGAGRGLIEMLVGGMGLVGAIAAVVTLAKTTLIPILTGLQAAFTSTAAAAGTASTAIAMLGGPVGIALAAVTALIVGLTAYVGAQEKARREEEQRAESLLTLSGRYDELSRAVSDTGKSEQERSQAAEEQKRLIKEIGEAFPELVKRWNEHGEAVELDTHRLNENTAATERNKKAKEAKKEVDLKKELERAYADLSYLEEQAEIRRAEIRQAFADNLQIDLMMGKGKSPNHDTLLDEALAEADLQMGIAEARQRYQKAVAEVVRQETMMYGPQGADWYDQPISVTAFPPGDYGKKAVYNPNAGNEADKAEKARTAAIREQMDLLRHLMAVDDERVDTAGEQLAFLQRIQAAYGSTRELAEAIYKTEQEITRAPLQEQLAAFERRRQLGEVAARQEQEFYEGLLAQAKELHLTEQERQQYEVEAILAKKQAEKEAFDAMMASFEYTAEMMDASTAAQLGFMKLARDSYAEGTAERKKLDVEVHRLEQQLQQELHDQKLAEIEFDAIVQRQTNDQKLAALRTYLDTEKNLTVEQKRDLQKTIAQMEQQAERDHQQKLLDLYRDGLEAQRRAQEQSLRAKQQADEKAKQSRIDQERARYEGLLSPLRTQLEIMQEQSQEIERQNRLLDLQKSLQEKDQAIADAKAIRNRFVIERDPNAMFGFRVRRTYDEAKVAELEKERAKTADDLAKEQARQQRDRLQESLQNQIRALERERDARLQTLNTELQDMRTKHGEQLEALSTYWADRLSTQALQSAVELTNWKTHFADVVVEANKWADDMNSAYAKVRRPTLETGADLSRQLGGAVLPPATVQGAATGTGTAAAQTTKVEQNFYGDQHLNGVAGVVQMAAALVLGATTAVKAKL